MRIAVIADIHGNVRALEAVLADIRRHAVDLIVDLGDCVSGPLWPRETCDLLDGLRLPTVRGNHERQLQGPPAAMGASDVYAHARLSAEQLARLGALPLRLSPVAELTMFHASPTDDAVMLLDMPLPQGGFTLSNAEHVGRHLRSVVGEVACCGHTHAPRVAHVQRRSQPALLVINPGSVGCPGFCGDGGEPFDTGSPHARYALLTKSAGRWAVQHMAIEYDWLAASRQAALNNRPEWARALATGYSAE